MRNSGMAPPLQLSSSSAARPIGDSASRLSISFRPKGTASETSCGSLSVSYVDPPEARALPSLLTAMRLIEQAGTHARNTEIQTTRTDGAVMNSLHGVLRHMVP